MKNLIVYSLCLCSVFSLPLFSQEEMIMLVVSKDDLTAVLKTLPEQHRLSKTIQKFPVAIGKQQGDKKKEGDHKNAMTAHMLELSCRRAAKKSMGTAMGAWVRSDRSGKVVRYATSVSKFGPHKPTTRVIPCLGAAYWCHGHILSRCTV